MTRFQIVGYTIAHIAFDVGFLAWADIGNENGLEAESNPAAGVASWPH
jgi:hypothetical protein